MRRKLFLAAATTTAVLAVTSCGSGDANEGDGASGTGSAEPMALTLAVAAPGLPFLQLYIAEEEDFYADRNLTVEFVSVEGSAAATAALQSGSADATVSLPEGAITAAAAGAPLKIIGTTVDENLYSMYGSADVDSLDDLEGKSIAILTEGNGTELQARRLLDEEGAGADASTYVATGALPNRLAAIQNGQVAGTLLFPPFDLTADEAGLPKLYDFRDLGVPYPNEVIAVSEDSIADNAEALQAFMDALTEASALIHDDFDRAVAIGADVTGSPEAQVRKSLQSMADAFSDDLSVSDESLESVLEVMSTYSDVENLPSAEDIYDPQFIG
jgi:NitT/TauT family transport system substrate-binding protein